MKQTNYEHLYKKIFRILGDLTPLRADCGELCDHACCKGDENTGMLLFPHEESVFLVRVTESGDRLVVCNGSCDRNARPLACRIFPFFPTIDDRGKVFVEKDYRAQLLCPMIAHSEEILFDPKFFRALKRVGKLLAKDPECRSFLYRTTEEIDVFSQFYDEK